ncbi:MAG: SH3 domain-containing protein [Nitrospinae bacterium]|nr:SH3 domain-containing protein [Nitrospinota bacterium]
MIDSKKYCKKHMMTKPVFIRFLIAFAIILLPHLANAETWYVKKSSTKLQAKASARSKVLGKLSKGTPVKIKGKSGKFFEVSTGGKTGWIFRFKLTKKAPAGGQGDGDVLAALGGEQKMSARESASGSSIRGLSPISEQHARKKGATEESIQAVKNMESFKVRPEELDRFLEEGKLGEYSQ